MNIEVENKLDEYGRNERKGSKKTNNDGWGRVRGIEEIRRR